MRALDFDTLHQPFDVHGRLALVPDALGPSPFMHQMIPRWTTPWTWMEVFMLVDVAFHFGDADHVLNLLVPNRDVD
jgi:hypothetical protein